MVSVIWNIINFGHLLNVALSNTHKLSKIKVGFASMCRCNINKETIILPREYLSPSNILIEHPHSAKSICLGFFDDKNLF